VSMAGLNHGNVAYFARAIDEVVRPWISESVSLIKWS
jgi:hypothetical protein